MCLSTQSFSIHHTLNVNYAKPQLFSSLDLMLWMYQACVGDWKAGHLTPWLFDVDFQLPMKPFHSDSDLLPPSLIYCIFYLSQRTTSRCPFLLLHQHFYSTPLLTGNMFHNFCILLPWHLFLHPQLLVELLRSAEEQTGKQLWEDGSSCPSPELALLLNMLLPRMNLFHFPGINGNICGVREKKIW